jgi:hypothetical protein
MDYGLGLQLDRMKMCSKVQFHCQGTSRGIFMPLIQEEPEREHRIMMDVILGGYGPEEQAIRMVLLTPINYPSPLPLYASWKGQYCLSTGDGIKILGMVQRLNANMKCLLKRFGVDLHELFPCRR